MYYSKFTTVRLTMIDLHEGNTVLSVDILTNVFGAEHLNIRYV